MRKMCLQMAEEYKMELYDWMYYTPSSENPFSYHHLIIPARKQSRRTRENGAILCQYSAHDYWHTIERYDRERALYIQKILVEVNRQGYMTTLEQYKRIDSCLKSFEREYSGLCRRKSGKPVIKEEYVKRLILK